MLEGHQPKSRCCAATAFFPLLLLLHLNTYADHMNCPTVAADFYLAIDLLYMYAITTMNFIDTVDYNYLVCMSASCRLF